MNSAIALTFACFLLSSWIQISEGVVYDVGDSKGWTLQGVNYTAWVSTKTFHVGDIIVFKYNKTENNVMEVNMGDYRSCKASSPLRTYDTGDDSFVMTQRSHRFFICGAPGHCEAGQKVNIRVLDAASPNPNPSASAPALPPSSEHSHGDHHAPAPSGSPKPFMHQGYALAVASIMFVMISSFMN